MEILYPDRKLFFNNQNLSWEWDTYLGEYGERPLDEIWLIYPQWLVFEIQYLKVCQNAAFPFNLSFKPTFYNMWFTRYMIVANSAIFSLLDVIKTLFGTPHVCSWVFAQRLYSCFLYAKSIFCSENLKLISTFWLLYIACSTSVILFSNWPLNR